MKAIKFKESDYYSIELPSGVYIVDGNTIELDRKSKVQVLDVHNIKHVTRQNIVSAYTSDGIVNISTDQYREQLDIITAKGEYEDYEYVFDSLDDEFEYKKFIKKWKPVNKNIETIGDSYSVEIQESQIDTGCKFVASDYVNGGKDPLTFSYDRVSAVHSIVSNKFKELGMVYGGKLDYNDTKHKKSWGNSSHSAIRYVVAFGSFIFGDKWQIRSNPRGGVQSMLSAYQEDKDQLEEIIQLKYNAHFGTVDEGKFNFGELLETLAHGINILSGVDAKAKSSQSLRSGIGKIRSAVKQIQEAHVE